MGRELFKLDVGVEHMVTNNKTSKKQHAKKRHKQDRDDEPAGVDQSRGWRTSRNVQKDHGVKVIP